MTLGTGSWSIWLATDRLQAACVLHAGSISAALERAKGAVNENKHYPEAAVEAVRAAISQWEWLPWETLLYKSEVTVMVHVWLHRAS